VEETEIKCSRDGGEDIGFTTYHVCAVNYSISSFAEIFHLVQSLCIQLRLSICQTESSYCKIIYFLYNDILRPVSLRVSVTSLKLTPPHTLALYCNLIYAYAHIQDETVYNCNSSLLHFRWMILRAYRLVAAAVAVDAVCSNHSDDRLSIVDYNRSSALPFLYWLQ